MARRLRCVVVLAELFAVACTGPARTPPPTAPAVDLARYAGTWYEIARLPAFFQRDCVASWAQYTPRPSGIVDVTNGCRTRDGRVRRVDGHARVVDAGRNARLLVRFDTWFAFLMPAPRDGNYWILDVTPDYDAAIVGTPDRGYLWLLARTPHPAPERYAAMVERARSLGFAVDRLVRDDWSGGAPALRRRDRPPALPRSSTSGGRAYDRYCAVAQTSLRPVTASGAVTAAPNPQPPKRDPAQRTQIPRSTGSTQRCGSCVGRRPKNCYAVIERRGVTRDRCRVNQRACRAKPPVELTGPA